MIQTNELKVGNKIHSSFDEKVHTVLGVIGKWDAPQNTLNDSVMIESSWLKSENCIPIPLTEEWLNKFGFTWIKDANTFVIPIAKMKLQKMVITFDGDRPIIFSIADYYTGKEMIAIYKDVSVQYVHQLQNLYFYLTGEELVLKETATATA